MRAIMRLSTAFALCAFGVQAQLKQGSLSIKGGETFTVGQKVMVTFVQTGAGSGSNAGKYDFYLSTNGGTKWSEFEAAWQGPKGNGDTVKYEWTVKNPTTDNAKWRACLMSGGHCSDPNFVLDSPVFKIAAATALETGPGSPVNRFEFDPASRTLSIAFSLASAGRVTLQAFDAQGRLLAVLMDEEKGAGEFALSLFSNRLQALHGTVAFKLSLGDGALTRSLVLP